MTTKLGRVVTYFEGLLWLQSPDPLIMFSCLITQQTKNISTTAIPMATKLDKVVTYHKEIQPKLINASALWFYGIT